VEYIFSHVHISDMYILDIPENTVVLEPAEGDVMWQGAVGVYRNTFRTMSGIGGLSHYF